MVSFSCKMTLGELWSRLWMALTTEFLLVHFLTESSFCSFLFSEDTRNSLLWLLRPEQFRPGPNVYLNQLKMSIQLTHFQMAKIVT
uniref:Uncharacterized protein n=1 Tax=Anguilla anguilla TaxID=7936 RepID=A0A0E9X901_ANGAN